MIGKVSILLIVLIWMLSIINFFILNNLSKKLNYRPGNIESMKNMLKNKISPFGYIFELVKISEVDSKEQIILKNKLKLHVKIHFYLIGSLAVFILVLFIKAKT